MLSVMDHRGQVSIGSPWPAWQGHGCAIIGRFLGQSAVLIGAWGSGLRIAFR
jgi:hypothetical protein